MCIRHNGATAGTDVFQDRNGFYRHVRAHPGIVDQEEETHLFDLKVWDVHAADNIGKQGDHIVVAHGHVGNNLLEGDLLGGEVLVLLAAAIQLEAQLGDFAL
jgi:hypothetical protein